MCYLRLHRFLLTIWRNIKIFEESYDVFDSDDDSYADMKLEKSRKKIAYLSGRLSVIE